MGRGDDFIDDDYLLYINTVEESESGGGSGSGDFLTSVIKFVVIGIVVIIVLALLIGVNIPWAVWELFLNIVLGIGVFVLIGNIGQKR